MGSRGTEANDVRPEGAMSEDERPTDELRPPQKKPYSVPRLLEYGSVAKLTQAGSLGSVEAGGMMMIPCL